MDDNNQLDEEQIEQPTKNVVSSDKSQVVILQNLEDLIKTHVSTIERLQKELKEHKETIENVLLNDPTYKDHSDKAKEANKNKSATKQEVMKRPSVIHISSKVKNNNAEIKERRAALSEYLQEYERMSGLREIEGDDGELREIVYSAKLVKKTSRG